MIDPALKNALRHLRSVRSQRPTDADPAEFADWRYRMAEALNTLATVLRFEEDRIMAGAEAEAARAEAAEIRGHSETHCPRRA